MSGRFAGSASRVGGSKFVQFIKKQSYHNPYLLASAFFGIGALVIPLPSFVMGKEWREDPSITDLLRKRPPPDEYFAELRVQQAIKRDLEAKQQQQQ